MPVSDISSVRGIGVAVSVRTSTSARSCLISSLCDTPNRCSSSTTSRPRSFGFTSADSEPVRADDDVDVARLEVAHDAGLLLRREEARQHLDPHRVVREALAERLAVLVGQQGGGHEHHDLLAVLHRLERGAHRDLGLAVADVAADQAVHRHRPLHVVLDVDGWPGAGRASPRRGTPPRPRAATACRARRRSRASRGGAGTARRAPRRPRAPRCAPWPAGARSRRRPSG